MNTIPLAPRSEWRTLLLLMLLSLVPATAGISRLAVLARGSPVTVANARFFAAPLPVTLHILSVIPYSILGALLFSASLGRRWPAAHRRTGRVVVVLGLVSALTGLWMNQFNAHPEGDGALLYLLRLTFGGVMLVSILMGVNAIRHRDFAAHGAWMIRGYAIGMGAGTQVLTHIPYFLLVGRPGEIGRALLMGTGWVINVAVAEWIIRRYLRDGDSSRHCGLRKSPIVNATQSVYKGGCVAKK